MYISNILSDNSYLEKFSNFKRTISIVKSDSILCAGKSTSYNNLCPCSSFYLSHIINIQAT